MDMNKFNDTMIRIEERDHVYFDLRPFADSQGEAMDAYLHEAVISIEMGASSFGLRQIVLLTDASMIIPSSARNWLGRSRRWASQLPSKDAGPRGTRTNSQSLPFVGPLLSFAIACDLAVRVFGS